MTPQKQRRRRRRVADGRLQPMPISKDDRNAPAAATAECARSRQQYKLKAAPIGVAAGTQVARTQVARTQVAPSRSSDHAEDAPREPNVPPSGRAFAPVASHAAGASFQPTIRSV